MSELDDAVSEESSVTEEVEAVEEPEVTPETPEPEGETAAETQSEDEDIDSLKARLADAEKQIAGISKQAGSERKKRHIAEQVLSESQNQPLDYQGAERLAEQIMQREREREQAEAANAESARLHESFISAKEQAAARHKDINLDEASSSVGLALGEKYGYVENSPMPQDLAEITGVIKSSEHSWDVIAELHSNPDLLQQVVDASPARAANLIGKIEARIESKPPSSRVTNAPDPTTPVGGSTSIDADLDDPNLTPAQYEAIYRKKNGGSVFPKR